MGVVVDSFCLNAQAQRLDCYNQFTFSLSNLLKCQPKRLTRICKFLCHLIPNLVSYFSFYRTMTIPFSPGKGYGFEIDGSHSPLLISWVSRGSPSDQVGLHKDDMLLSLNGHDVREAMSTTVQAIISYSTGSPLTMKVARHSTHSSPSFKKVLSL